jgi:2-iminobutanoate/2-iminopropanoate deaminase
MAKGKSYSPFIVSNESLYSAGQLSIDEEGNVVGIGDITAQTIKSLENMKKILIENDLNLENVATVTIYLQDIDRDFLKMDEAYKNFFGESKPARTTVQAKLYNPEWLIELNFIASKDVDNRESNI